MTGDSIPMPSEVVKLSVVKLNALISIPRTMSINFCFKEQRKVLVAANATGEIKQYYQVIHQN